MGCFMLAGNVLYWFGCGLACCVIVFGGMFALFGNIPKAAFFFFLSCMIAGLIWAAGRACRYVLSGT
jgi:hypothetical protein